MKAKRVYLGAKELSELKISKTAISNISVIKELKIIGFKVVPSIPTSDQVAKINRYTRREFKAEELYVGQLRLSNNCIDRDNERFSEEVIQRFVATTLRRTMLLDHNKQVQNAIGKFFDVELEKMPLQQAVSETGEELTLPDGITEVWFHSPWFYVPREGVDPEDIIKIDAGIYDFASIGFRAESLIPIMDKDGDIRFWEYRGNGKRTEMTEGSLVYLGAQYGMTIKSYGEEDENGEIEGEKPYENEHACRLKDPDRYDKFARKNCEIKHQGKCIDVIYGIKDGKSEMQAMRYPKDIWSESDAKRHCKSYDGSFEPAKKRKGGKEMQDLIKKLTKLFPWKNFTEENLGDEIEGSVAEAINIAIEKAKKEAEEPLREEIEALKPLAEDGKAYRDGLVITYVAAKAKLGEVSEKPEEQTSLRAIIEKYPIDFLKSEVAHLEKRVAEKFPDESQTQKKEDEDRDKSKDKGKEKENKLKPKEV